MKSSIPITNASELDPRIAMGDSEAIANQVNRFPVVADQKRGHDLGLIAGVIGALALGALTLHFMSTQRAEKQVVITKPVTTQTLPATTPIKAPIKPIEVTTPVLPPPPAAPPAATIPVVNMENERNRAPALIMDNFTPNATAAGASPINTADAGVAATKPMPGGLSNEEIFAFRVGESGIDRASATSMKNPSQTITQGSLIAAVLETGINSDLPGYVRAFVSRDVRGFDNKIVLIPKGSRLIGQYKSGISAGQMRVFILWSRLIRPDGVSVMIASPATDLAGETGLSGDVNSHFFKRYGVAILLSAISAVAVDSNDTVVLSANQSAASAAAQNSANISPTITVAQGQPIRIFTARDLDFSTVDNTIAEVTSP